MIGDADGAAALGRLQERPSAVSTGEATFVGTALLGARPRIEESFNTLKLTMQPYLKFEVEEIVSRLQAPLLPFICQPLTEEHLDRMRSRPDAYFLIVVPTVFAFLAAAAFSSTISFLSFLSLVFSVLLLIYTFIATGAFLLRVALENKESKAHWQYVLLCSILSTSLVPWILPLLLAPIWPSPWLLPMWARGMLIPIAAASSLVFLLSLFSRLLALEEEETLLKNLAGGKKPEVPSEHRFSVFRGPQVRPRTQPKTKHITSENKKGAEGSGYLHHLMKLRVPLRVLLTLVVLQMVLCATVGDWLRSVDVYTADVDGLPLLQARSEEWMSRSETRLQELEEGLSDRLTTLRQEATSKVSENAADLKLRIQQLESSLRAQDSTTVSTMQARIKQLEQAMRDEDRRIQRRVNKAESLLERIPRGIARAHVEDSELQHATEERRLARDAERSAAADGGATRLRGSSLSNILGSAQQSTRPAGQLSSLASSERERAASTTASGGTRSTAASVDGGAHHSALGTVRRSVPSGSSSVQRSHRDGAARPTWSHRTNTNFERVRRP